MNTQAVAKPEVLPAFHMYKRKIAREMSKGRRKEPSLPRVLGGYTEIAAFLKMAQEAQVD